jgi:predicted ArsR family transcriptional regulator
MYAPDAALSNSVIHLFLQTASGMLRRQLMLTLLDQGHATAKQLIALTAVAYAPLTARLSELRTAGLLVGRAPSAAVIYGLHSTGRPETRYSLTEAGTRYAQLLREYKQLDDKLAELAKTITTGA